MKPNDIGTQQTVYCAEHEHMNISPPPPPQLSSLLRPCISLFLPCETGWNLVIVFSKENYKSNANWLQGKVNLNRNLVILIVF